MKKYITFKEIKEMFDSLVIQYDEECAWNKGAEGTTRAYGLQQQIELLQTIAKVFFDKVLEYKRNI